VELLTLEAPPGSALSGLQTARSQVGLFQFWNFFLLDLVCLIGWFLCRIELFWEISVVNFVGIRRYCIPSRMIRRSHTVAVCYLKTK
jgi:hypothetical protein